MKEAIKIPEGVEELEISYEDGRVIIEFAPRFKEGDFICEDRRIMIVEKYPSFYKAMICPPIDDEVVYNRGYGLPFSSPSFRFATEEEKKLLLDALEKDGKKWNAEKLCIEDIPKSNTPEQGKLAIFWNRNRKSSYIRLYKGFTCGVHCDNDDIYWDNAIKFESQEQFEEHIKQ